MEIEELQEISKRILRKRNRTKKPIYCERSDSDEANDDTNNNSEDEFVETKKSLKKPPKKTTLKKPKLANLTNKKSTAAPTLTKSGTKAKTKSKMPIKEQNNNDIDNSESVNKLTVKPENDNDSAAESSESEWEEVSDHDEEKEPFVSKDGIEITLEIPDIHKKKKKKSFDVQNFIRLRINQFKRDIQRNAHKVHLLCLMARQIFINGVLESDDIRATVLSIVPDHFMQSIELSSTSLNRNLFQKVIRWFQDYFELTLRDSNNFNNVKNGGILADVLLECLKTRELSSADQYVLLFVVVIRLIGFDCRVVMNFEPVSHKASNLILKKNEGNNDKNDVNSKDNENGNLSRKKSKMDTGKGKSVAKVDKLRDDEDFDLNTSTGKRRKSQDKKQEKGNGSEIEVWMEVYFEEDGKWICIDHNLKIIDPQEIHKKLVIYVVAINSKGHVKDVTKRYSKSWHTATRKMRIDSDWWQESLSSFRGPSSPKDKAEDEFLDSQLEENPLPKSISEFKSHPLYALQRHLLKFEGIYPSDAIPFGYIRGEAVYARVCVRTLHSRDTWLREARVVRIGELPYKLVRARPKWNKSLGMVKPHEPLELFGEWQTEDYLPLPVENGKIPRNAYGNVELFKPSMLPLGAVHLQDLPSLNRIARKLNIDCAPAMTGWDFHSGVNHPVFDGWVVCQEHADTLVDAWREDQQISEKRAREKRQKEIYKRWRKLIRGLLIRERLKLRYSNNDEGENSGVGDNVININEVEISSSSSSDEDEVAIVEEVTNEKAKSNVQSLKGPMHYIKSVKINGVSQPRRSLRRKNV